MSSPSTTNQTASAVNKIIKELMSGAGVELAKAAAYLEFPWLQTPIVKQIFEFFLNKVANYIYIDAATIATKIIVDIQIKQELSKVSPAFQNLQMAIASGDKNAIQKASDDLDEAYGSLIHYDGDAPA